MCNFCTNTWLVLILLLSFSCEILCLVRFCYKGWQEVEREKCQFGIIFKEPIHAKCYFTLDEEYFSEPLIYPNVCQEPFRRITDEEEKKKDKFSMKIATSIQKMQIIEFSERLRNNTVKNFEDWMNISECEKMCNSNLREESQVENEIKENPKKVLKESDHSLEDSEESKEINPPINPKLQKEITDQTLRLGDYLFDQLQDPEDSPGPDLRIVKIFTKTVRVLGSKCADPFINRVYLSRVLYGFLFLVNEFGTRNISDVNLEEFKDITEALEMCEKKDSSFRLEGSICSLKANVKEIITWDEQGKEITQEFNPAENPFDLTKYDLFIESAWRIIDAVHGACFVNFRPNTNMHHRFQRALEQLFTFKMQERWLNPTELDEVSSWGSWFLTDVESTFENLQACVKAAYLESPFKMRLDRPVGPSRVKRAAAKHLHNHSQSGKRNPDDYNPGETSGEFWDLGGKDIGKRSETGEKGRSKNIKPKREKNKDKYKMEAADFSKLKSKSKSSRKKEKKTGNYWDEYRRSGGIAENLKEEIYCLRSRKHRDELFNIFKSVC